MDILLKNGELFLTQNEYQYTHLKESEESINKPFEHGYFYIMDRMKDLPHDEKIIYPLWAWYRFKGRRNPSRYCDELHHGDYRITFEIDDSEVLLTDFDMFCYLLSGGLYFKIVEEDEYYEQFIPHGDLSNFYPNLDYMKEINHKSDGEYYFSSHHNTVQATFWKLSLDMVLDIRLV